MTQYVMPDGEVIQARDRVDLVLRMRRTSWAPAGNLRDFMTQMADRCQLYDGSTVRVDQPEHFVDDLISNGLVRIVS